MDRGHRESKGRLFCVSLRAQPDSFSLTIHPLGTIFVAGESADVPVFYTRIDSYDLPLALGDPIGSEVNFRIFHPALWRRGRDNTNHKKQTNWAT